MKASKLLILMLYCWQADSIIAQEVGTYQTPPKEIANIINNAPTRKYVSVSPNKDWMLLIDYESGYSSVASLAVPELKIAGIRINPDNNSPSRIFKIQQLKLKKVSGDTTTINIKHLPTTSDIAFVSWSPDGENVAFCQLLKNKVELWVINVAKEKAWKVTDLNMCHVFWGNPYQWMPDSRAFVCKVVPLNRGEAPKATIESVGPIIQYNEGKEVPARTLQGLLENAHDEELFDYYATSQLALISLNGAVKEIGKKGIISNLNISPDGKYILTERIHRPYSYLVNAYSFPTQVNVYDVQKNEAIQIYDIPVRENIPIGRDGVQASPRGFAWRPDLPSTLYWIEAQDGGDPKVDTDIRDKIYTLDAPFISKPIEICKLGFRFDRIIWCNDTTAILIEKWWAERKAIWTYLNPSKKSIIDTLFSFSSESPYSFPGEPQKIYTARDQQVLALQNDGSIFLFGQGASLEGDQPFIDAFNLKTKAKNRIWQSKAPYFETAIEMIDSEKKIILTRRESKLENPNFFLRNLTTNTCTQVTFTPNPLNSLLKIQRQEIKYKRDDGITLRAELYLPGDYDSTMGPLPTFIWAYPIDYKEKEAAGQVKGSPYTFLWVNSFGALLATQGYAVIDNASFPIVSQENKEPNDTYIEQLISNAKAAINEGVRLGVTDSSRVAIGGHSYGAFMAANLLTHSKLFKAGIAMSGAYNRTLTPFGFQREYRSYWKAPELYNRMSPFQHADQMKAALLLVHGEADNVAGTHTMQSERYFNALKGLGATARYVCLPFEEHSYRAKESIMHIYWEACVWLEKYLETPFAEKNQDDEQPPIIQKFKLKSSLNHKN